MARVTHAQSIGEVAKTIGENLELVQVVTANSDNIDYGEMIWVDDGTEEGIKTLSDRGIECLQELLADIRTWPGGIIQFLRDEECDPDLIQRIMADEKNRLVQTALGVGLRFRGRCFMIGAIARRLAFLAVLHRFCDLFRWRVMLRLKSCTLRRHRARR